MRKPILIPIGNLCVMSLDEKINDSFVDGAIDGLFMKRLWDDDLAKQPKGDWYILGEVIAGSTNPVSYYCALLDYLDNYKG